MQKRVILAADKRYASIIILNNKHTNRYVLLFAACLAHCRGFVFACWFWVYRLAGYWSGIRIAQLVEHKTCDRLVEGLIPGRRGGRFFFFSFYRVNSLC